MLVASRSSALLDGQGLLLFREAASLARQEASLRESGSVLALERVSAVAWFGASSCDLSAYLRAGAWCDVPLAVGRSIWQVIVVFVFGQ